MIGKDQVSVPYSNFKYAIAQKLVDVGYLSDSSVSGEGTKKRLMVTLKYDAGTHCINGVKRMSTPGRRLYSKVADIYPVKFGKGNVILSTPAGILTDTEARNAHVGGEQLFMIW